MAIGRLTAANHGVSRVLSADGLVGPKIDEKVSRVTSLYKRYVFILFLNCSQNPLKLVWFLTPYNLAMAALNLFICLELLINSRKLGYDLLCEPVHDSNSYNEMGVSIVGCIPVKEISEKTPQIRRALWWFYFSKLLEFTDTFCFIVRKKDNQLTFLHVYHHSTMPTLWWIGVKWVPSGSSMNLKVRKIEEKIVTLLCFTGFLTGVSQMFRTIKMLKPTSLLVFVLFCAKKVKWRKSVP
jgi:GNS1/SUR4 family